ncbi:maleylpyruvate isomerase family mycothiol-dependent enzyme [Streptomyces sp. NPDC055078]
MPDDDSWLGAPIDARSRFLPERAELLALLRGLSPGQWRRETVPGWTVRDMAAHLLGDDYGRISRDRDGHREGPSPAPGEPLESFIHRINQEWVEAYRRVSPAAITESLELTGAAVADLFQGADLQEPSLGVSWAGADPAPLWLDCAREFTEHWTHRQQIRHATGLDTDPDPHALGLVLDTFMRALPHTLRTTRAEAGTQVTVAVTGPVSNSWTATATTTATVTTPATATGGRWSLAPAPSGPPAATVRLDAESAWRLCVRAIDPATALDGARIEGDRRLADAVCRIVSIVR